MTLGVHPLFCSKTCFYMFLRSKQTLTSCNLEASVTFRLEQLVKLNPLLSWSAESLSTGESFRFTSISWCDLIPAAAAKWAIGDMSCLSFVWFLWLIVPFFVCLWVCLFLSFFLSFCWMASEWFWKVFQAFNQRGIFIGMGKLPYSHRVYFQS